MKMQNLPQHIGFIYRGWKSAMGKTARSLPTYEGHLAGYNALKDVALETLQRGVKYASAYVFSTENWKRSEEEVGHLMKLLLNILKADLPTFIENKIRLRVIGSREDSVGCNRTKQLT
ncbi:undecaprenyl diphosphate synthase family protein [Candidatus Minimicrobia naudis]|uniref:Undecaprenyl diphosphate synthase family protein n=1 Tax=Candidatus Minimicrobia naudis TaxID=2841263 RepID=A0A8F1MCX8_9BACT|nr:undecaprenyl diphosphate synthase family protein [Candidatus Minimicrobia naudis]